MNAFWRRSGIAILAVIVVGLILPSDANVERTIRIDARPAMVFALLNDFRWAAEWTTRTLDDPNARTAISGPLRGVDAMFTWDSAVAGSGSERIVASDPYNSVETLIDLGGGRDTRSMFALEYDGALIEFSGDIDQPVGKVSLRFTANLYTLAGAPGTLVQV